MMNELQLVDIGGYGVVIDVSAVNKLVTTAALDAEIDRLVEGHYDIKRRLTKDEIIVQFESYKDFVFKRLNACKGV